MTVYVVIGREANKSHNASEVAAVYSEYDDAVEYAKEMIDKGILNHVYVLARRDSDRIDAE